MKSLVVILALVAVATAAKHKRYLTANELHKRANSTADYCTGPLTFRCADGLCIQSEWVCDTDYDCIDRSDEANCSSDCTGAHKFQCTNGSCIASEYRCDGINDCRDQSDEQNCHLVTCSPGEKKCANELCLEVQLFCNGHNNCGDNSDEQNCPSTPCEDRHTASDCAALNQTSTPICLNPIRAEMFCKKFCNICS